MEFKKRDIEGLFDQINFFSSGRKYSYGTQKEFFEALIQDTQHYVNEHTFGFFGDKLKGKLKDYLSSYSYSYPPLGEETRLGQSWDISFEEVKDKIRGIIYWS